jgi:hypothetical protein
MAMMRTTMSDLLLRDPYFPFFGALMPKGEKSLFIYLCAIWTWLVKP